MFWFKSFYIFKNVLFDCIYEKSKLVIKTIFETNTPLSAEEIKKNIIKTHKNNTGIQN